MHDATIPALRTWQGLQFGIVASHHPNSSLVNTYQCIVRLYIQAEG